MLALLATRCAERVSRYTHYSRPFSPISLFVMSLSDPPKTLRFPRGSGLLLAAEAAPLGGWPHHSLWWPCWPLETCR